MHFVLDVGPQRDHGLLHHHVEQSRLDPKQQRGNQIQRERQRKRPADGGEVDPVTWHHVHAGQQVGERVVAASPGSRDGLFLGDARGQLPGR